MTMPNRHALALTLAAALLTAAPLTAQAAEHLVTVTGHGTIAVAPDTAMIRIGVTSQGKTARDASAANAQQMTKVLNTIEQSGIAKKDIQTSRLSLQPQYDPKNGTNRLLGFQVTNQITVRIHKIGDLPSILDKAISAGANEMSGINSWCRRNPSCSTRHAPTPSPTPAARRNFTPRPPAPRSAGWCRSPGKARARRRARSRRCVQAPARFRWRRASRCCGRRVTVSYELGQ